MGFAKAAKAWSFNKLAAKMLIEKNNSTAIYIYLFELCLKTTGRTHMWKQAVQNCKPASDLA